MRAGALQNRDNRRSRLSHCINEAQLGALLLRDATGARPSPVISNECEKSLFASLRLSHFYFLISSFCFLVSLFPVLRHPIQKRVPPRIRPRVISRRHSPAKVAAYS